MFTQAKVILAAGVGIVIAALAGLAGYFKLRVAQKDKQIADTKAASLAASEKLLRDAQNGRQQAGVKADEKAMEDRAEASRGDRSHFE